MTEREVEVLDRNHVVVPATGVDLTETVDLDDGSHRAEGSPARRRGVSMVGATDADPSDTF
ncbi:MAG: hypothetical protein R2710_27570 [Acidimicrobiales bacterium]